MGLYNMIFGESGNADALLESIGLTRNDFYRYRDCYLTEDNQIAVYTRGGGGNRECWCGRRGNIETPIEFYGKTHDKGCVVVKQETIRKHPLYRHDADDSFDRTYATFYFDSPETPEGIEVEMSRNELWIAFLTALKQAR